MFNHKMSQYETSPCEVEKIIELPRDEFMSLLRAPLKDRAFITENADLMEVDQDGVYHGLLVLGESCDDGLLIESEGYDYARRSAFVPGARQIVDAQPKYQCVVTLENRLSAVVDDVMSRVNAYDGGNPCRILISDLVAGHHFDEAYVPLLVDMLNERTDDIVFENIFDEITAYRDQPEETLPGPSPLPYAPERMEHLLDKALDWIGQLDTGAGLYDTLKTQLGMTDEEITAAGFETLKEYYTGPDEGEPEETGGMKL
ncbi:MAG: DUF6329 domain-containing protein, partial [Firmicutes bacterium]|nr:DUF6329 domain-containing protein [Bacillota bacterium]